jgi:hypothetical protein
VGLDSGIKVEDFKRKKLNLIILLDVSGSMSSPFDTYYYDQFTGARKKLNETGKLHWHLACMPYCMQWFLWHGGVWGCSNARARQELQKKSMNSGSSLPVLAGLRRSPCMGSLAHKKQC